MSLCKGLGSALGKTDLGLDLVWSPVKWSASARRHHDVTPHVSLGSSSLSWPHFGSPGELWKPLRTACALPPSPFWLNRSEGRPGHQGLNSSLSDCTLRPNWRIFGLESRRRQGHFINFGMCSIAWQGQSDWKVEPWPFSGCVRHRALYWAWSLCLGRSQSVTPASSSRSPWELVRNAHSWAHPRHADSHSLGLRPSSLGSTSPLGDAVHEEVWGLPFYLLTKPCGRCHMGRIPSFCLQEVPC